MATRIRLTRRESNNTPLPYTASPLYLFWSDICLAIQYAWALPWIVLPLRLGRTSSLDELHLSLQGAISVITQLFLAVFQLLFLLCLPILAFVPIPVPWALAFIAVSLTFNYTVTMLILNGFQRVLESKAPVIEQPWHQKERWLYINGVANGLVDRSRCHCVRNPLLNKLVISGSKTTSINCHTHLDGRFLVYTIART